MHWIFLAKANVAFDLFWNGLKPHSYLFFYDFKYLEYYGMAKAAFLLIGLTIKLPYNANLYLLTVRPLYVAQFKNIFYPDTFFSTLERTAFIHGIMFKH